jgi:uncharacterized protein
MNVDELGIGIVYFQALAPLVEERGAVDVLEIEPQVFWLPPAGGDVYRDGGAALGWLRDLPMPKIVHGVGFPVGTPRPPDPGAINRFVRDTAALGAIWASEHLSFNRVAGSEGPFNAGFLLPPRQTAASVNRIAATVRSVAARLPVPFAIETGVNYLQPRADELSDGAFIAAIAELADCGILLDLHNIWANERNGRQRFDDFLREIPLDRVVEVHLAGGELHRGYWLDAHSGAIPLELLAIAHRVLRELPSLRALVFEVLADQVAVIGLDIVRRQLDALRRLWDARSAARSRTSRGALIERRHPLFDAKAVSDAEDWEDALGALACNRPVLGSMAQDLVLDPGLTVIRDLVDAARAGAAVDALRLSIRLLRLALGNAALSAELRAFWDTAPPSLFGAEEGVALGEFLARRPLTIPHFAEVLALERALLRVYLGGGGEAVTFTCDPEELLTALVDGRLPPELPREEHVLHIGPSGKVGA